MLQDKLDILTDLQNAVDCLRQGGIILYPTDTIWGIGCDATSSEAVKRIYNLKERSDSKSMIVLVNETTELKKLSDYVSDEAINIINSASSPTTIIYESAKGVTPELIAPDGTLGIRVTNEFYSKELCKLLNKPLVSTSANKSGEKSPANFSEISEEIKRGVDYIVKYRQEEMLQNVASRIIKINKDGLIKILR